MELKEFCPSVFYILALFELYDVSTFYSFFNFLFTLLKMYFALALAMMFGYNAKSTNMGSTIRKPGEWNHMKLK